MGGVIFMFTFLFFAFILGNFVICSRNCIVIDPMLPTIMHFDNAIPAGQMR